MGMIPGLNNLGGMGGDKESQMKFRKYDTIMDSMTEKELDETDVRKLFDEKKIRRIAYGSGSSLVRCFGCCAVARAAPAHRSLL